MEYINDILIFSKKNFWISIFIKLFFNSDKNFEITNKVNIDKYLRVNIQKKKDSTYKLRELFLIKRILNELNLSG
jgi:hypothetical protein